MNHWHTVDQMAAGRRADLEREAAGGIRMRVASLAEAPSAVGSGHRNVGVAWLAGRRQLAALRSDLALLVGRAPAAIRVIGSLRR